MEKLTINKHYKVMGEWILTYDNKRFKAGSPEFKKWCKEQKLKTDKVKIKKVPQVKQKKEKGNGFVKEKRKKVSFSPSEYTSTPLLLFTIIPMVLVVFLAVLSALGLIIPIVDNISDFAVSMFNDFELLYLVRTAVDHWGETVKDAWLLILFPVLIVILIISFVLDVVLGIIYLVIAILIYFISLLISIIFVYALCPGIVVLEIIMVIKSFKNTYSITNKGWSIVSMFITLFATIVFYVCYINLN